MVYYGQLSLTVLQREWKLLACRCDSSLEAVSCYKPQGGVSPRRVGRDCKLVLRKKGSSRTILIYW